MIGMRARPQYLWTYPLIVFALLIAALVGAGCGGSGSKKSGGFNVSGVFANPYTGRDVPGFVGSLKVTTTPAIPGCETFVLHRGESSKPCPGTKQGTLYRFSVTAYQGTSGNGSVLGSASFERVADKTVQDVVINTVDIDIASVTISPADATLKLGESQTFSIGARNRAGQVVITPANDSSFSCSLSGPGTWNASTFTYTAPSTAPSEESARVTCTFDGKSASATINLDFRREACVNILWNALNRGIPGYARSARVVVSDAGGNVVDDQVHDRTSDSAYTQQLTWPDTIVGDYDVTVTAFADFGGGGAQLGQTTFPYALTYDPDCPDIDMGPGDLTQGLNIVCFIERAGGPVEINGDVTINEGEIATLSAVVEDADGNIVLTTDRAIFKATGPNVRIDGDEMTGVVRGNGSSVSVSFGDTPPADKFFGVDVVFGNPGIIIIWDPITRDNAWSYSRSFVAQLFQGGSPVPGFNDIYGVRPTDTGLVTTTAFWPDRLTADGDYEIRVTLYPNVPADNPAVRGPELGVAICPFTVTNGTAGPCTADFSTTSNATDIELNVTRADGSIERYTSATPPPPGRRNGPLVLSYGEKVSVSARATDATGTTTYFNDNRIRFESGGVVQYNSALAELATVALGNGSTLVTADSVRGPSLNLDVHVYPPAVVAFSDFNPDAFGTGNGAVRSYLYVPGALVNSPRGDKIWEVPYRDDSYLGRPLAEPGVVLPTGQCNGYDAIMPALNSRADKLALVVAPFDTTSGDVTYYKDLVVMEVSYDANGAPVFGGILPQNEPYNTRDEICPMFGPQTEDNGNGVLYFSSMEFNRDTGAYLGGQERDIFNRTNVYAASSPGQNMTSGVTGNLLWPAIAPDNQEMAVIRKLGFGRDEADVIGMGQIVTIDLSPFAPSGEQIDVTAWAASRIGYVASMGVAPPNGGPLVDPDKYYIAFTRSFDGGVTPEVQLIRAERTQAALGAFIPQQANASNPFGAALDGASVAGFRVRNPRRVMVFLYNGTQIRAKHVTSPAEGGIGTEIWTLNPNMTAVSQPVWPAPLDQFPPLAR